jgi:hypothetical protein
MVRLWTRIAAAAAGGCVLACAALADPVESGDGLIAKNLAARGGAEKLAALKSVLFAGETRFPGDFRLKFASMQGRLNPANDACAVRVEMSVQGLTFIQAYDGKTGWRVNPFQGRKTAERLGEDEARSLADSASIDGVLLASRAKGSKVEYLGREDIDGTDAYKLRVNERDGDVFTYYLDPDTFLEIKILERRKLRGAEGETETELGEYEQVGGVYFPFSIASGAKNSTNKQLTTIESGEANPAVAADLFAMPSGSATAKLTTAGGK